MRQRQVTADVPTAVLPNFRYAETTEKTCVASGAAEEEAVPQMVLVNLN